MQGGVMKVFYTNGDTKVVRRSGTARLVHGDIAWTQFPNGDHLQEFPDGATAYQYAANRSFEFRLPDGRSVIEFRNGQREYRDGKGGVTVAFADGTKVTGKTSQDFRTHK
jgi:hypothetical protein